MPPLLSLASQADAHSAAAEAATEAVHQVSAAVAEDGAYLLIAQVRAHHPVELPMGKALGLLAFTMALVSCMHVWSWAVGPGVPACRAGFQGRGPALHCPMLEAPDAD
jgi:hypothetical protein